MCGAPHTKDMMIVDFIDRKSAYGVVIGGPAPPPPPPRQEPTA